MSWERMRRALAWALGALLIWTWLWLASQDQQKHKPITCYATTIGSSCDGLDKGGWDPG